MVLTLHDGTQRSGPDLADIVEKARAIRSILRGLPPKYPQFVVEQAAIAHAQTPMRKNIGISWISQNR